MSGAHVMIVMPSLTDGGTERVVATLLPYLRGLGCEPHLVLFEDIFEYPVPDDVRCTVLGKRSRWSLPRLIRELAGLIRSERPDVVYSRLTYANLVTIAACRRAGRSEGVVVSEHSVLSHAIEAERYPEAKRRLVRALYPRADRVLAISSGIAEDLVEHFAVVPGATVVIHNPVDLEQVRADAREPVSDPWLASKSAPVICAVGRLNPEKDYPTLLRAASLCADRTPLRLLVLGKGPDLERLEALAGELGIEESVRFVGQRANVFAYMARCEALVLSSRYEGFGNVLLEAMACETPVVSTDCPCGPGEIVTDGVDGMLVPVGDPQALSDAILEVLGSPELARRLVERGVRRAEDFDVPRIAREYAALFEDVSKKAPAERGGD